MHGHYITKNELKFPYIMQQCIGEVYCDIGLVFHKHENRVYGSFKTIPSCIRHMTHRISESSQPASPPNDLNMDDIDTQHNKWKGDDKKLGPKAFSKINPYFLPIALKMK